MFGVPVGGAVDACLTQGRRDVDEDCVGLDVGAGNIVERASRPKPQPVHVMSRRHPHDLGQPVGLGVVQAARRVIDFLPVLLRILFPLPFRQPVHAIAGNGRRGPRSEGGDHHATTTRYRDDQVCACPSSGIHLLGRIDPPVQDGPDDGRLDGLQTSATCGGKRARRGQACIEGSGSLGALARRRRGPQAGRVGGGTGHREHPGVALDPGAHDESVFMDNRRLTRRANSRGRSPRRNGPGAPRPGLAPPQVIGFSGHALPCLHARATRLIGGDVLPWPRGRTAGVTVRQPDGTLARNGRDVGGGSPAVAACGVWTLTASPMSYPSSGLGDWWAR